MIDFNCPTCREPMQANDDYAGKSVVCPHCQRAATVPPSTAQSITTGPTLPPLAPLSGVTTPEIAEAQQAAKRRYDAEDERLGDARAIRRSWLRIAAHAGIVVGVVGVLTGLLIPAIAKVREAAARTQSTNNLKNIALAFHGFHDGNKRLPFNGSDIAVNEEEYSARALTCNSRSGSWAFQIIPYIDSTPIFNGGGGDCDNPDPGPGPNLPIPAKVRTLAIAAYLCPGRGRPWVEITNGGGAWTDYFYNNYLNDPEQAAKPDTADKKRTLIGITDGTSNTVLVGHGNISTEQYANTGNVRLSTNIFMGGTTGTMRAGDNGETRPTGVALQRDSAGLPRIGNWGGPFSQGAMMAMGDATVRLFPYSMTKLNEFLTPTGGELFFMALPDQ